MSDLLNSASLVMIPSGYKEDVVYSEVPTNGNGDLSFTRASNGTRVNSAGLVEVCPWNLATNSENYTLWNLANVTVTANDITAPNGTLTADKLTISNNANDVKQTISVMPNSVYTWTFYVYGGTALGQQMRFYDNTNSTNIEYYNYSSSVVLGAWVKIERTFTTPSGCYEIQAWVLAATSTIGTMWVWGAQLNIGSTAKPYFPTTDRLNVPRLTYQNGGGGCPSLLLEKQSTNLVTYSEQFDQWSVGNLSVTANNTTSPDGTQNADLLTADGTNIQHFVEKGVAQSDKTYSVFAKMGTQRYIQILTSGTAAAVANFDLQDGVANMIGSNSVASIQNYGNGWYRCILQTNDVLAGDFYVNYASSLTMGRFGATTTSNTLYIWGGQAESGSYPTSYIPTTSSSATRVADACSKTGISSLIGQTEGTLFVEFVNDGNNNSSIDRIISVSDGTANNRMYLARLSGGDSYFVSVTSGTQTGEIYGTTMPQGVVKIAVAYKNNDVAMYVNGSLMGNDTSHTTPATSNLYLGQENAGTTNNLWKPYKQALLFPTRLTNAELASLTTI